MIEKYQPSVLAVEKMFITQKNAALLYVAAEQIKAVAKEAGISIWEQPPLVIRKRLCKTGRATKREVSKIVANRYPELVRYYNRTKYWEVGVLRQSFRRYCRRAYLVGLFDTSGNKSEPQK